MISLFSCVSIEETIPAKHPLWQIRLLANEALKRLDRTLDQLYTCAGRPSIPPEQLLLTLVLQAIYGVSSERLLLDQLHYNPLYHWLVGLGADDPICHNSLHQKPRTTAEREGAGPVSRDAAGHGSSQTTAEQRPFLGGWHPPAVLGIP